MKKANVKNYKSDQEVRWCAGCGDFAVLNAVYKAMAEMNIPTEDIAVVSGIGCSSRFPYYMGTYGFHGIHGRAPAISSGVKVANPKLSVWQITGDGDALAIGGNHFIHVVRRNIDINLILFNNQIYGLTKGQYSPTSKMGAKTKSSPFGTVEQPFNPGELVIGARGKFFARVVDANIKMCTEIFKEAEKHKGLSVVEVLQNCVIFNEGIYNFINDKKERSDRQIFLKDNQAMIFGKNKDKGLMIDGFKLKVVEIGKNGITEDDILIHDAQEKDTALHNALINMRSPEFPIAMGVIRAVKENHYDDLVEKQIKEVQEKTSIKNMDDLLCSGSVWEVK
ncbi:MAG: 2-oxoacid:ferredoxin oxidoreductase subunit beta [Bacteroidetes bacterium 4572_128]|nr:MAG: 2-oxoacid:ferredoxin oxidoreductase subunit beta [Bacteroidetes bacterium 4572_128]